MRTRPLSITLILVAVAILLGAHGLFRLYSGGVVPFGAFLESRGIPAGRLVAWAITLFELVGPVLLILGRLVVPVAIGHILILIGGIVLVHASSGWFVVGGGQNGVEYNILLIVALFALIQDELERSGHSS
jgi:putative oxidoreductase